MFETFYLLKKQMKIRLVLIVAVCLLFVPQEWAVAADLTHARTGKHEKFARVVFEFQNAVKFKSPEINGKGNFSLIFLNSTTKLPRLTSYKTGKTQMVRSIEYVQQESNLKAIISLTFPYFILKSYALSAPDRIVVDAYWMTAPTEKNEPKESLPKESPTAPSPLPEKKEISNMLQKTTEKTAPEPPMTSLTAKKPLGNPSKTSQNAISDNKSNQIPEEKKTEPPSSKENNPAQTYLLVVLDIIAGCIVLLLAFTLFKKKRTINVGRLYELLDFIKASDQRITDIDDQIQSAFKQYDQF
jgi:hypothetical protein